jgi:hypothetical protein
MKKIICIALMLCCLQNLASAQDSCCGNKKFDYYAGIQVNELIKQVINFNNTSASNNPYLFHFAMNNRATKLGFRLGLNYDFRRFDDGNDASSRITNINKGDGKLGIEKIFSLGGKWSAAVGIDGIFGVNNNFTKNIQVSFDSTIITSQTKITTAGGGPGVRMMYKISKRILLGAETYAYAWGQATSRSDATQIIQFGNTQTFFSGSKDKTTNFRITYPTGIFLIAKF